MTILLFRVYSSNNLIFLRKAMIICFNCSAQTKKHLDHLLDMGNYNDYSEVISNAIDNLVFLESEMGLSGSLVLDRETMLPEGKTNNFKQNTKNTKILSSAQSAKRGEPQKNNSSFSVPDIFSLQHHVADFNFAVPSEDKLYPCQIVPVDQWLFGQFNKFLPAKVSCRALANLLSDSPNGLSLGKVSLTIAESAALLGDFLARHDKKFDLDRDSALALAFPTSKDKSKKSIPRYSNHFVGRLSKNGDFSGLLSSLKFVNIISPGSKNITLTKKGLEFTSLENPVLDTTQKEPNDKFSSEEISFLINHIFQSIPVERFAYKAILEAIASGANSPHSIDTLLSKTIAINQNEKEISSFHSSQRAGAISRMSDLGLLRRNREGVKVYYEASERGQQFLATCK